MKATVSIAHGRVNVGLESDNPLEADCLELFGTQARDHDGIWIASHGSVPDARRRSVLIQPKHPVTGTAPTSTENSNGITVRELKALLAAWPNINPATGEDNQVWLMVSPDDSSPAVRANRLGESDIVLDVAR